MPVNLQPTIDHRIVGSFQEFVNWEILNKGRAFSTISTGFFKDNNSRFTGLTIYSAPFKSFIYDNGISGATILTGVSGDGSLVGRGTSGMVVDYMNGRVLFTGNPNFTNISGTFSVRDFNVKVTDKNEEDILINTKYVRNPISTQTLTGIAENTETYPIILIKYTPGENVGRALGGMDSTNFRFSCYCIMDNIYNLDGVLSILRDTVRKPFGLFDLSEMPINISGDLKDTNYSYTGICTSKIWPDAAFITRVRTSKLSEEINKSLGQNVHIGVADYEVTLSRYPRQ